MPAFGGIQRVSKLLSDFFLQSGYSIVHLSSFTVAQSEDFYPIKSRDLKYVDNQYFLPEKLVAGKQPSKENVDYFLKLLDERKIELVINNGGLTPLVSELAYICKLSSRKIGLISAIHSSILGKLDYVAYIKEFKLREKHLSFLIPILKNKAIISLVKQLYEAKVRSHFSELCRKSDRVVLLSEALKPEIKTILGSIPDNVVAISNPTCMKVDSCEPSHKCLKLVWVGRADEGKRLDFFVKIWERVFRKFPDWSADVLGEGPMLDMCKRYVSDNNIERINFRGVVESKDYFKNASIFCFTTTFEGFGLVLLEAMSSLCVPISFHSFATVTDLIDDSVNGVLVKPFDISQYAEKLEQLMSDNFLLAKMAHNAFEKAKNFSMDNIGAQWIKLINDIIKQ